MERKAPSWLSDALSAAWHEAYGYLATAWAFTRGPHAFIRAWWTGQRVAPSPLAMLATGAALVAATRQLAGAVLGIEHPDSLLGAVLSALGPYAHYVAIGALCHLVLRNWHSRVTVLDSIAAALFAGAGPAALVESLGWLVLCALHPFALPSSVVPTMLGIAFSVFCFTLATALGSLHRPPWWRMVLAFALAFPTTGLVFGVLRPPGSYGLHWVLDVHNGIRLGLGM